MTTKFAVIYSKATGRIRWEFHPDNDEQLNDVRLLEGEAVLILKNSDKALLPNLQNKINKKTGKTPTDDRYAIVDKDNNVIGAIIADPSCGDEVKDCELIAHPTAGSGWKVDSNKQFVEPVKELTKEVLL